MTLVLQQVRSQTNNIVFYLKTFLFLNFLLKAVEEGLKNQANQQSFGVQNKAIDFSRLDNFHTLTCFLNMATSDFFNDLFFSSKFVYWA